MKEEKLKTTQPDEVRVRFAPSPTGNLHIGSARTALFNYLFARANKGKFVLRIEDTDKERSKPEYEKNVIDGLKWLGIEWDEGPDKDGSYGPYRQSERLETYKRYLEKLLKENNAYYCFCSEEDTEAERQYQLSIGEAPRYNGKCSKLTKEEVEKNFKDGKSSVIRFKIPPKKVKFNDLIRGPIEFDTALIGDTVIAKDLMNPLYNFSVVIDDFEMKISHVIRGEEHISNTPRQIVLQEALGLPQVKYAHIPIILAPDRSKLSKRHGATAVLDYQKDGYLPEAIINFIAFLGWNPGSEREIYSLASLCKEFSLDKIQKAGAVFNIKRLDYLNGFYIRHRSIEKLTELCIPYLVEAGLIEPSFGEEQYPPAYGAKEIIQKYKNSATQKEINFDFLKNTISLYQERLKKLSEIVELTDFFFKDNLEYDKSLLKWKEMSDKEIFESLNGAEEILSKTKQEDWIIENLTNLLMPEAEKAGDRGRLLWPLRASLTGKQASAGPFEIMALLGKEETLKRIKRAKELIK